MNRAITEKIYDEAIISKEKIRGVDRKGGTITGGFLLERLFSNTSYVEE